LCYRQFELTSFLSLFFSTLDDGIRLAFQRPTMALVAQMMLRWVILQDGPFFSTLDDGLFFPFHLEFRHDKQIQDVPWNVVFPVLKQIFENDLRTFFPSRFGS
jgi:hypothetical protein